VSDDDRNPPPADAMTRRQRLADILDVEGRSVEALAAEFRTTPRDVEADLRSLEKTLRHEGKRLVVQPARCGKCGFVFEDRSDRRFTTPGKCPKCRATHIQPAILRIK
jgi:Predicted transcriptional regulator containing an HTH domain fused to a Zn-ribbon